MASRLRASPSKAVRRPGFLSGETVLDLFNPGIFMTVSRWTSLDAWEWWEKDAERQKIVRRINALLQSDPVVRLWQDEGEELPAAM